MPLRISSDMHKLTSKTKIISEDISLKKAIEILLNRSEMFLLYFHHAFAVKLWEKKLDRTTAYSCSTNVFIEYHHLKKKNKHRRLNNSSKNFLNQWESMGFCELILYFYKFCSVTGQNSVWDIPWKQSLSLTQGLQCEL